MPVAPPPMTVYTRLHDPVAHAKSEQEAKEVGWDACVALLRVLERVVHAAARARWMLPSCAQPAAAGALTNSWLRMVIHCNRGSVSLRSSDLWLRPS